MRLTNRQARRLCVQGQLLAGPRPTSIAETVHGLWMVQMDPTATVARTEHLVLFSRLGRRFEIAELERMLWTERSLFEYWVHIVPTKDLAVHRESMRRFPNGPSENPARRTMVQSWLEANVEFRRYLLRELRRRGPLRARDLEDRSVQPWRSGGWNDTPGRHVSMMLDILWCKGEVMIVGRDGQQRIWDLAARSLPMDQPRRPAREVARDIVARQLLARGAATVQQFGRAFDGRPPGWERALQDLIREGIAIPTRVEGSDAEWFAHAEVLERPWRPRTVLLSPFDDLVSDRDHAAALFDFFFRLEIYVPKAKRRWGYFVLPILHGDRLIGRIDPRFDRATGVLHVNAVHAEEGAAGSWGGAVAGAISELAAWLGAERIDFDRPPPPSWRRALLV
jgi:uncharacterized protein YcaQ